MNSFAWALGMDTCPREVPKYATTSSEDAPICWVDSQMATDQPLLSAPIVWQNESTAMVQTRTMRRLIWLGPRHCIVVVGLGSSEI